MLDFLMFFQKRIKSIIQLFPIENLGFNQLFGVKKCQLGPRIANINGEVHRSIWYGFFQNYEIVDTFAAAITGLLHTCLPGSLVEQWMEKILAGTIAQLVEQWTENPCVLGSNPSSTTRLRQRSPHSVRAFFVG